jgi:hypothetical protein
MTKDIGYSVLSLLYGCTLGGFGGFGGSEG